MSSQTAREQIDLSYALLRWQPRLANGERLTDTYGEKAGHRYSDAEDGGIFRSNDHSIPIMQLARDLRLEPLSDSVARSRRLQDRMRGRPPSRE